jgi:hypothetical protein
MSGSDSGKTKIRKYVPEMKMGLREFLTNVGIKDLERHTILVNGHRASLEQEVDEKDEIIVLPILRGG